MNNKLRSIIKRFYTKTEEEGLSQASGAAAKFLLQKLVQPPSIYLHSKFSGRWNVFNEEWDLLIILDTCRPDALRHVASEYDFIQEVNARWSVGSSSPEWIANTFDKQFQDHIAETAYITSNPQALTVLEERLERRFDGKPFIRSSRVHLARYCVNDWADPNDFHTYLPLYDVATDYGPVKHPCPRAVTDHVIKTDRDDDPDRIIAHYMPPHTPYIAKARGDGTIDILNEERPSVGKEGFVAYLDNLRWALNEVEVLLSNVDRRRVIISADHGENFRLRWFRTAHTNGMIDPSVRRVPWVETSASDERTYKPELSAYDDIKSTPHEEMLEALGYLG